MKKFFAVLLVLIGAPAFAAPTFVKAWTQWEATSPASSASTTPGAAGNSLAVFGQNSAGASRAITPSAAAGTTLSPPGLSNDSSGDTHGISINLSLTAGAQVATLTGTSGTDTMEGVGVEYSGIGTASNGAATTSSSPGAGAGAIQGAAITVPTGSILVARAVNVTSLTDTITVAVSGTSRASNNNGSTPAFVVGEWAGAGASITPSFTSANGASNSYKVMQFIFNPPAGGSSKAVSILLQQMTKAEAANDDQYLILTASNGAR